MKPYLNDAVAGDGQMLACFTKAGSMERLYWPHPDRKQQIEKAEIGFLKEGEGASFPDSGDWSHTLSYVPGTNIIQYKSVQNTWGLEVNSYAFALPGKGILVRTFELKNQSENPMPLSLSVFTELAGAPYEPAATLFDTETGGLIHYTPESAMAVVTSLPVYGYQITDGAGGAARSGDFCGKDNIGMTGEGALGVRLGTLRPYDKMNVTVCYCLGKTVNEAREKALWAKGAKAEALYDETFRYWQEWLLGLPFVSSKDAELDALYHRSLLTFALMCDKETGGILAAPEVDETFSACGRYGYCWGRDAGFVTAALDAAGMWEESARFFRWAAKAQSPDGSWQQRYTLEGALAPSWGLQMDETGTVLWGLWQHIEVTNNEALLKELWEMTEKGADFLCRNLSENGLPVPSFDLWEERYGQHLYSAAAVWGGLRAAAEMGKRLHKDVRAYEMAAETLKNAISEQGYHPDLGRFIRSRNSAVNGDGLGSWREIAVNAFGDKRWVAEADPTVDISLLGLSVPFGVFGVKDKTFTSTAKAVWEHLSEDGLHFFRYQWDNYRGGNPWVLAALWMGLYLAEAGEKERALYILRESARAVNEAGLLPEQTNPMKGGAVWVTPLTWSHAMYVLLYRKLFG